MVIFTKNSTLKEILTGKNAVLKLKKHGVPCPNCPMAAMEMNKLTIGMIASTYDLDLKAILDDLNNK